MLLNIIFFICFYPIMLIMYFVMKMAVKSKKNIVLGVTLPSEYLEESEITEILNQYKRELKNYTIIFAIIPILFIFVKYASINLTLWTIWMMSIIFIYCYPYIKYNKKLRNMKKDKKWKVLNPGSTIIDMKTATERIRAAKKSVLIPALIISFIPCIYELLNLSDTKYPFTNLIIVFSAAFATFVFFILALSMDKQKSEVISFNSDINITFNRAKKHIFAKCMYLLAWVNTVYTYVIWAVMEEKYSNMIGFMLFTMLYTILITYISLRSYLNINKIRQKVLTESGLDSDKVLIDDDSNWMYGMIYYNPNDRNFMVDKRFGMGSTINVATTAGKVLTGFGFAALLSIPIMCIWLIFEEFTPVSLEVTHNQIIAEHLKEEYTINQSDIKEIKLMKQLPDSSRVFGTGMDNVYKGTFSVEGYGKCELCLNPKNNAFIVIITDNCTYIFSDENNAVTLDVYKKTIQSSY